MVDGGGGKQSGPALCLVTVGMGGGQEAGFSLKAAWNMMVPSREGVWKRWQAAGAEQAQLEVVEREGWGHGRAGREVWDVEHETESGRDCGSEVKGDGWREVSHGPVDWNERLSVAQLQQQAGVEGDNLGRSTILFTTYCLASR